MSYEPNDPKPLQQHPDGKEANTAKPGGVGCLVVGIACLLFSFIGMSDISDAAKASPTGAMGMGLAAIQFGLLFCVGAVATLVGLAMLRTSRTSPARLANDRLYPNESSERRPHDDKPNQTNDTRWYGIGCLVLGAVSLWHTLVGLFDLSTATRGDVVVICVAFCFGVVISLVGLVILASSGRSRQPTGEQSTSGKDPEQQ